MFTIDRNKSLVNFTGSDVLSLQTPNHASHLTVGGSWYQRLHCLNLSHSQRGKVCSTNCTRQLSTFYWTHHTTPQLKLNNCAGCMRKRSLFSRCPTYILHLSNKEILSLNVAAFRNLFCNRHVPGLQSKLENDCLKCPSHHFFQSLKIFWVVPKNRPRPVPKPTSELVTNN